MKKSKLSAVLVVLGLVALPTFGLAAVYQYADSGEQLRTTMASSASEALVTAPNIHPNSGVKLVGASSFTGTGGPTFSQFGSGVYEYADINENLRTTRAVSPTQALETAPNIHPHSGVKELQG